MQNNGLKAFRFGLGKRSVDDAGEDKVVELDGSQQQSASEEANKRVIVDEQSPKVEPNGLQQVANPVLVEEPKDSK